MHEVGLMQSALAIAIDQAKAQGAHQIHQLELAVGQLSGVEPEALAFAFEVVTPGTPAAGAKLVLRAVPALCYCAHCQQTFEPATWIYRCPSCQQLSDDIRQGKDLQITSLEVS